MNSIETELLTILEKSKTESVVDFYRYIGDNYDRIMELIFDKHA